MNNLKLGRVLLIGTGFVLSQFIMSYVATYYLTGLWQWIPTLWFVGLVILGATYWKQLGKWVGILSVLFMFTSCNYIPSDQIGVWVKDFGRTPEDYSIVMGKFPKDFTRSTWAITFSGKPFPVSVDPIKVNSKDGIQFTVDPSVLCQLTRSNEACRKYAFKLSSYKSDVETGLQEMLLKEVLDVARNTVNSANGDSVMFNQTKFSELAQDALFQVLKDKYGIELMQFSMSIEPPRNLQEAINDRLLAEQETKKTLASVANEEALVKLQTVKAERAKIEQAQLTPAMLRKMELETMTQIYEKLSKSPNKVIIVGNPEKIILNN